MNFKAICSDIDGTLLNSERDLSPRLKSIIGLFPKEFPVILASSRMPDAMRHLLLDLGKHPQSLISYNGGFVLSSKGEILEDVSIPLALVEKILRLTEKTEIHVSLYQGENWYEEKDDYWSQREIKNTKVQCTWMKAMDVLELWNKVNSGAHKVMCMGSSQDISWLFGELHWEHAKDLHLYRSSDTYLEIAPRAISKATGLRKILSHEFDFGMDEVIAFGDNFNDIDLLQSVGWGVAVANARPEVKAVAKEVTSHHKEDGVAATLERFRDVKFGL
ncbi:Cof-type HAD-IIB family hydrolase [Algoriphagus sp. A40]|uniref:Cof-type HAD-IIB family hydrolase n=1 Tax=Algoriphagus sp. A40 TaxID=1945863 RepID=UPI0009853AA4|nr:Cof-type HAD-IIB family hydrolase [Algoriphagus sp. A40]OOG69591.1 haloacid dehalogenase [Algoriphagus sp. A40]